VTTGGAAPMPPTIIVMPALVAGIHVFLIDLIGAKDVDGRDKPGHDAEEKAGR
jgi:hypothetical protein